MEQAIGAEPPPPNSGANWTHPSLAAILEQAAREPPLPLASELLAIPRQRALEAVRVMPGLLANADEQARDDRELALAALPRSATVFEHLSERLRDDEDVVMAAANGWQWDESPTPFLALEFASERLRHDRDFLDVILRSQPAEYAALDEAEQLDPVILERVFGPPCSAWWVLDQAPDAVRRDPKWARMAIKANPFALQHARGDILDDFDLGLRAVSREGHVLQWLSPRLRDDDTIAKAAIAQGLGLPFTASERLRDDEDFIATALIHASAIATKMGWTRDEVERNIMQRGASPRVKALLEAEGRAPVIPDLESKSVSDEDIPF
jgi:hypothetical protein